jgi:hypothetical protein
MGVATPKIDQEVVEQIYELYAERGLAFREISRRTKVSVPTVIKYVRRAESRGLSSLARHTEEMKLRQTHQYLFMYREAVAGWERSQQDAVIRKQSEKNSTMGDGGDEFKQDIEIKGRDGDPRFMQVAMQAIEGLRLLWGLDAPASIDLNFRAPANMNPALVRARNEAARVVVGELLSPAEQSMRQIGAGSTPAAAAQSAAQTLAQEIADAADRTTAGPDSE